MTRVNTYDKEGNFTGWFEPDKATKYKFGAGDDEIVLFYTASGRWVKSEKGYLAHIAAFEAEKVMRLHDAEQAEAIFKKRQTPGRPRVGDPILIRLPEDTIAKLDRMAESERTSRSEIIRQIIAAALEPKITKIK